MIAEEIVKELSAAQDLKALFLIRNKARDYMDKVYSKHPSVNDEAFNAEVMRYYRGEKFYYPNGSRLVEAIRYVRNMRSLGLKEAKDYVERLVAQS